jgi:prepilin-type processing-associated H-X9-DG protein
VVIAIVAILASILLPALGQAKSKAVAAKCKGNTRQLALALQMYVGDFHAFAPMSQQPAANAKGVAFWFDCIAPYADSKWSNGVFVCPGFKGGFNEGRTDGGGYEVPVGAYAYNAFGSELSLPTRGLGPHMIYQPGIWNWPAVKESDVKAPSEMFSIGDGLMWNRRFNGVTGANFVYMGVRSETMRSNLVSTVQHGGRRINIGCVDGHVEFLELKRLFSYPSELCRRWNSDNVE